MEAKANYTLWMQVIVDFRDSQTFLGVAVGTLFCSNLQDTGVNRARMGHYKSKN